MVRLQVLQLFAIASLGFGCAAHRAAAPATAPLTATSVARQILPHNVRIFVYDGKEARRTASGVVVGSEISASGRISYVVTNAHALTTEGLEKPGLTILVDYGPDSVEYSAEPVAVGQVPEMDLALVKVRGVGLEPAVLAEDGELEPGEDVVVAAAPYGKPVSLSGGMISQVEWDRQSRKPKMLKTDAAIGYGASGGGVFSRSSGRLLAIIEGYRTAKVGFAVAEQSYSFDVPMPGETFAAPSAKVREFLQVHGFGRLLGANGSASSRVSLR